MRPGFTLIAALLLAASVARAELDVTLGNGDSVRGSIVPATQTETFRVSCPAGAKLTVALATTVRANAKTTTLAFHVFDPDGTDVAADAGPSAKATVVLTKSGEHRVVVSTDGLSTDEYKVAVSWRDPGKSSDTVPVGANGTATFQFAAEAGTDVSVRVAAAKKSRALPSITRIEDEAGVGVDLDVAKTKFHAPTTATYTVTFADEAGVAGDVVVSAAPKAPRPTKRALLATTKEIPLGMDVVAASVVGPLGGSFDAPATGPLAGARFTAPAKAFSKPTLVAMGVAPDVPPRVPERSTAAGVAAFVAPFGRVFASTSVTPTLRLPYATSPSVPALATLHVFMAANGAVVLELLGGSTDEANSRVTFPIGRLASYQTYFVTAAPPAPLFATDGDPDGELGRALAVAGAFVYAGQPNDGAQPGTAGKVRVFELSGSTIVERLAIFANDAQTKGGFGSSIAVQKDVLPGPTSRLLVLDRGHGAVHVFVGSGVDWTFEASLKPPAEDATGLGHWDQVAADGDTVCFTATVGAGSPITGAKQVVYSFRKIGADWTLVQTLKPSAGYTGPDYGWYGLSLSGDDLFVACPRDASFQNGTDFIQPFARLGGAWVPSPRIFEPAPAPQSNLFAFGTETVAVDGDDFAVASAGAHDGATLGTLYLGSRATGGAWAVATEIPVPGTPRADPFGPSTFVYRDTSWSVAMQGGHAAFASWNRERVLVCEKRLGAWRLILDVDAAAALGPQAFASRVAIDGNCFVVGARDKWNASLGKWVGAIAVFDLRQ